MIQVTKTIYIYADGHRRVERLDFYVRDMAALESKRRRDCRNLGCERIRYVFNELDKRYYGKEDEKD